MTPRDHDLNMATTSANITFGDNRRGLQVGQNSGNMSVTIAPDRPETPPEPSSNVPFRRDPHFVERATLTDQIRARLEVPSGRVALVGLGGVGKSQLAIEYAYRVRARSPTTWVLWIHASNAARFEQSVREVAEQLKIRGRQDAKTEIFELLWTRLRDERKGRWLIVLDNVDAAGFLLEPPVVTEGVEQKRRIDYLPVCDHGALLVTSRSVDEARKIVEHSDVLVVRPMSPDDAVSLLEKKLGPGVDATDAVELGRALDFIPLALTQAAAYIIQRGSRCSVQRYLKKLQNREKSVLDETADDHRRDRETSNSIVLTWRISFEHIYLERRSAADLLAIMSFCDRQSIPESLVRGRGSGDVPGGHIRSDEDADERSGAGCGEDGLDRDGKGSIENGKSDDPPDDNFDLDIAVLEGYSFVSVTADDLSMFEMHRLVQHTTQRWLLSQGQLERYKEQHVDRLYSIFPPGCYENWGVCQALFPHARSLLAQRPQRPDAALQWASVMHNAAWYAWTRGNSSEAVEISLQSLRVRAKKLGDEATETMESRAMLALAKKDIGEWKEAEELEVKVMEASSRTLGEEHPNTLIVMGNLASTYWNQGRWKEAEELEVKVIEARSRTLGEEHPGTLTAMANLASTYWNQGRWKEAEELEVKVIEASSRTLGEEHPSTLTAIAHLAWIYLDQGRWKEAEELGVKVVGAKSRRLGEEHPDMLTSMNNLAITYFNQERWAAADDLQVQAVDGCKKSYGPQHPHTLAAISTLEYIQRHRGEHSSKTLPHDALANGNMQMLQ